LICASFIVSKAIDDQSLFTNPRCQTCKITVTGDEAKPQVYKRSMASIIIAQSVAPVGLLYMRLSGQVAESVQADNPSIRSDLAWSSRHTHVSR
jgi:hypothetical protein